jgi:hypothetical protein
MIDLYCERAGPGLFAGPVNALTNIAFWIAAWAAWSLARRERVTGTSTSLLTALIVIIGVGSTLFHTFATGWARFLDEFPILVF